MTYLKDESGSIAPLAIGLISFTALLMMTTISASSLFIFQKRLTTVAESAALFVASTGGESETLLALINAEQFQNLKLSDQVLTDSRTVRATACALWSPIIVLSPEIGDRVICSNASARLSD